MLLFEAIKLTIIKIGTIPKFGVVHVHYNSNLNLNLSKTEMQMRIQNYIWMQRPSKLHSFNFTIAKSNQRLPLNLLFSYDVLNTFGNIINFGMMVCCFLQSYAKN